MRPAHRTFLAACLALLGADLRALAQVLPEGRVRVRTYGEEQGLLNQNILALQQDEAGLLYVGTGSGLYRFDGGSFALVPLGSEVSTPTIQVLHPARGGGMWVGTIHGLARVHQGRCDWATFEGGTATPSILGFAKEPSGQLWVSTDRGLYLGAGGLHFRPAVLDRAWGFRPGLTLAPSGAPLILQDLKGGLHRRTAEGGWVRLGATPPPAEQMVQDTQGRIWHIRARRLYRIEADGSTEAELTSQLKAPLDDQGLMVFSPTGGVWVTTVEGFQRLGDPQGKWVPRHRGLPEENLMIPFEDREGQLWIGGVGLCRLQGHEWLRVLDRKDGLPSNVIWGICRWAGDGQLYVGTSEGLARLEGDRFRLVPGGEGLSVTALVTDRHGNLWVPSRNRGLLRLSPGSRKLERETAFQGDYADGLAPGLKGGVLVTGDSRGALNLVHQGGRTEVEKLPIPTGPHGKPGGNRGMVDAQGRLWVTSSFGLNVYDGGRWRTFTSRDGLAMDRTLHLAQTDDGEFWVRYEEAVGVSRLRYDGSRFEVVETFNPSLGASPFVAFGVFGSRGGDVWVLTDRGLIQRRNGQTTVLTTADGLPTNDCDENAFHRDPDGTVWVGLSQGVLRLDPRMPQALPAPAARVTVLASATGQWLLTEQGAPATFRHREGTFLFRCGTLPMAYEGGQRYQVRLQGLEEDWRNLDSPMARYPGLREGTYTFQVRAARLGEGWGPVASLQVRVLPPWYRSWWAYLGYLALGGLGVRWVVTWRLRAVTHQRDLLEAQVAERTREIDAARQELEVANANLRAQSLTDPLTGLHNRRFLEVALPQDVRKAVHLHRHGGSNGRRGDLLNPDLVFFLVDMDHFKHVNDSHGHSAGDEVLRQAAMLMRQAIRDTDAVVRWGGEEFLLIARETSRDMGPMVAERICGLVRAHRFNIGEAEPLSLTCSVGFTPFPVVPEEPESVTWERAVDVADLCLYLAKHSGRNGWVGTVDFESLEDRPVGPGMLKALADAGKVDLRHSFHALAWMD